MELHAPTMQEIAASALGERDELRERLTQAAAIIRAALDDHPYWRASASNFLATSPKGCA